MTTSPSTSPTSPSSASAPKPGAANTAGSKSDGPTNDPPSSPFLQNLREITTVVLSLVILGVAVVMLWTCFVNAGTQPKPEDEKIWTEAYNRQKDIMLYGLSLLGTVTGYFLGRVPVELRAQQAEQSANKAQDKLTDAQKENTIAVASATSAMKDKQQAEEEKKNLRQSAITGLSALKSHIEMAQAPTRTTLNASESSPNILRSVQADPLDQAQRDIESPIETVERKLTIEIG